MPVPKKRHSQTRSNRRHAMWKVEPPHAFKCPHCGAAMQPHRVCLECGTYKGIPVLPSKESKASQKGR